MINIRQKILNSINNNRLKLIEWKRNWYNYIISIQELVWSRNFYDWYKIDIYNKEGEYLDTLKYDTNLLNYYYLKLNKN